MEGKAESVQYWRGVYEEHGPSLMAFLVSRLGRREDAEDLVQETFIRAIRAHGSLRDESKLKSYLFSVAHNLMVNHVRRHRPVPMSQIASGDSDPLEHLADTESTSPEEAAHWAELNTEVQRILETLSEKYRVAFQIGVLDGRPYADIARDTGWSPSQVKINIYRARRQMIDALRERGFLDRE